MDARTPTGGFAEGTFNLNPATLGLSLDTGSTTNSGVPASNPYADTSGTVEWTLYGGGHGDLIISITRPPTRGNAGASALVTGPGISESAAGTTTHPISFPGTFVVRCVMSSYAYAAGMGYYYGSVQVSLRFVPTPFPAVRQQTYGSPCGASLAVTDTTTITQHVLDIVTTGGAANGLFLLWFGTSRAAIPIPGSPCLLLTDPAIGVVLMADGSGAATLRAPLFGPLQTIPIDLQSLAIDTTLRASEGVELTFADY